MLPPMYVINLDRSPDRWVEAQRDLGPVTEQVIRMPGVDGAELPYKDVKRFHDGMRKAVLSDRDNPPDEWVAGHFSHDGCATERTFQIHQKTWRGKYGCYLSHIRAVEMALADRHERFMIVEDDAIPRSDVIEAVQPGREDGLYLWGGGLVMNNRAADEKRYWTRRGWTHEWQRIPATSNGIRRVFGTTAYELTAASGERFLKIVRKHPLVMDCAWWYAMLEIPTYRVSPRAFGTRWSEETSSTIGRNAPRIPYEKWIENGVRPEDLALIGPEYEDPKRWRNL